MDVKNPSLQLSGCKKTLFAMLAGKKYLLPDWMLRCTVSEIGKNHDAEGVNPPPRVWACNSQFIMYGTSSYELLSKFDQCVCVCFVCVIHLQSSSILVPYDAYDILTRFWIRKTENLVTHLQ